MLKIVHLVTGVAALLLSLIPSLRSDALPYLQQSDAIYLALLGLTSLLLAPSSNLKHPSALQSLATALVVLAVVLQILILLAPLPFIGDQPAIVLPLLSLAGAVILQWIASLNKPSASASIETFAGVDRETGTVKWFNTSKGFGFISRDSGEDIFVHFRAIRGEGHRILIEGQRVEFSVVQRDKGLQAEDVIAALPNRR
ncbi:cold-shock protein [Pseudomonas nitroreducens]|uniref:Cold-shock protein n=1 Tax=Pseudomonas nitroreducens TaxID=46680 RepID=A0A6G6J1D4_PSENT|nr:cold-shock protein [Pseudomonas nitroreducens]MBG6286895.1 cold-shock protein [Pseudomonas nitroreducens]NMZ58096.1 cold-shock protein [Pseudomonas nitroreducens]NMZ75105.1 cold-shock protein [Pseudomonas nitroreducens]NNN26243.1 cold-shock protein [Pseudomonas nitroreducens]QIE89256.1 cold-shock protein [Pseudomonas nitroreducens]